MVKVLIEANVLWKAFRAEGGRWVAVCDPLALTIESETWAELMEDIGLSLNAMLKELLKTRDLEKFLRDRDWHPSGPIPSQPDDVRFDVPFTATRAPNHDPQISLH